MSEKKLGLHSYFQRVNFTPGLELKSGIKLIGVKCTPTRGVNLTPTRVSYTLAS